MNPSLVVAQTCPMRGDVDANVAEHLRLARLAADHGASLVVFPELSLTGYELELAAQLAFTVADSRLEPLRDAARSEALTIVAGAPLRIDGRIHIGAFVITPDGAIAPYTKQRLGAFGESARRDGTVPPPEASVFQPGTLDPVVRWGDGTAAVAICADIGDASHPQRAAERGASAYLASMFVIPSEYEGDSARLQRYAAEHSMCVAFANYGSATGGLRAAGQSAIWSEHGERIVQLPPGGSGIAVATPSSGGWRAKTAMLETR
jgi:predicted amidohydrolase